MKKKSNRLFIGILVGALLLGFHTAGAQIEQALDSVLALRLDSIARQELGRQDIIGMSVGVVRQGKVAFLKGYGFSDWENRVPVGIESEFRWASMSKSLTSIAALKLREQGLLNLDTVARAYVPNWPDSAILVRYLLQNRSGIGHYNEMDQLYPVWKKKMEAYQPDTLAWNAAGAVEMFREAPLVFRPDSTYLYTTFGFVLAGAVVDQIGHTALGMGYLDMVNNYVIQPLGLQSLKPDYTFDANPLEVKGYYRNFAGDIRPRQDDDISWKIPGGGYASNIIDLTKYVQGLIHRKLIAPESYQTLWERQRDRDYALGFEVKGEGAELFVAHTGSQNKTRTIFACYPNLGLGVAVMCNTEWANPRDVAERLLEALRYSGEGVPAATGQGK